MSNKIPACVKCGKDREREPTGVPVSIDSHIPSVLCFCCYDAAVAEARKALGLASDAEMVEEAQFTCPSCGGHTYELGPAIGLCHGYLQHDASEYTAGFQVCSFRWPVSDTPKHFRGLGMFRPRVLTCSTPSGPSAFRLMWNAMHDKKPFSMERACSGSGATQLEFDPERVGNHGLTAKEGMGYFRKAYVPARAGEPIPGVLQMDQHGRLLTICPHCLETGTEPCLAGDWAVPEKFDFGTALRLLKDGKCVARSGWNGKNMYLFLGRVRDFEGLPAVMGGWADPDTTRECIFMVDAQGMLVPGWLASQTDMLAEDWVMVVS